MMNTRKTSVRQIMQAISIACTIFLFTCSEHARDNPLDPEGSDFHPPVVTAMADTMVAIRDTVTLHATATDPKGGPIRFLWSFDSKTFADTTDSGFVRHAWSRSRVGKNVVLVKAIDEVGAVSVKADTIVCTVRLYAPVVTIMPDTSVSIRDTFKVHAVGSDSSDGIIRKYLWAKDTLGYKDTTDSAFYHVVFRNAGPNSIRVMALDDDDVLSKPDTTRISVRLDAPLVAAMGDTAIPIFDSLLVSAIAWDSNGTVKRYLWSFDGKNFTDSTETGYITKAWPDSGQKMVLVKAKDDDDVLSIRSDTVRVHVKLMAPIAIAMNDTAIAINDTLVLRASGIDSNGTVEKYYWAFSGSVYADSTDNAFIERVWPDSGKKMVLVKVRDEDGMYSLKPDTVWVRVELFPPVVTGMEDTTVGLRDSVAIRATAFDTNGTIMKYYWSFDGAGYTDSSDIGLTMRSWPDSGMKTILVKVRDDDGNFCPKPDTIKIQVTLYPPTVIPMLDTTVSLNDSFYVHADGVDPNGNVEMYHWALDSINFRDSSVTGRIKTAFSKTGTKTIKIKVRDNEGNWSNTARCIIKVFIDPPSVVPMSDTSVAVFDSFYVHATGTAVTGTIVNHFWAFDGKNYNNFSWLAGRSKTAFNTVGVKTIKVMVVDSRGVTGEASFKVTVSSLPPTVTAMNDTTVAVFDSFYVRALGVAATGTIAKYVWAFDGVNYKDSSAACSLKTVFDSSGEKTVKAKAIDNRGESAEASFKITVHLYRPVVSAMADTTVATVDSFFIHATANDTNGVVKRFIWARDGINFLDTTATGQLKTAFSADGEKTIIVKAVDDDGIASFPDTVLVTAREKYPMPVSPSEGVRVSDLSPVLRWIPGLYSTSFKVLLDTVNPPVAVADDSVTGSQFTPTTSLVFGKTYYWQIIGIDSTNSEAAGKVSRFLTPETAPSGMTFIPGGTFQMGQSGVAEPIHSVTVSSFYSDVTEVTQQDYQTLMGLNPSAFTSSLYLPVENLTWYDALLYCNKRSKRDGLDTVYRYTGVIGTPGNKCTNLIGITIDYTKYGYRLPTEAEWEFACRGKTTTAYYWGEDSTEGGSRVWSVYNSENTTHPVGSKLANAYGLYDMAGNVWEWCNDWWGSYAATSQTDPAGPATATERVVRGGDYNDLYRWYQSAFRDRTAPEDYRSHIGFRCVRGLPPTAPSPPKISTVIAGNENVVVSWDTVVGALYYNLYHSNGSTVTLAGTKVSEVTSPFTLQGLTNGTQVAIAISAVNGGGESGLSTVATATPQPPAPSAPVLSSAVAGNGEITAFWSAVSGATSYNIYWAEGTTASKAGAKVSSATSPCVLSGLTNGHQYSIVLTAVNGGGESEVSAVATLKPQAHGAALGGMRLIECGTFQMGQSVIAEPIHGVTLSSFYMDTTEVTQADYLAVMGVNPSNFKTSTSLPVEMVTWYDAVLYCNKRSKMAGRDTVYSYSGISGTAGNGCSGLTGLAADFNKNGYRLPTEAEWEYACRAGTATKCYWWGDSSASANYAWSYDNSDLSTHPIAQRQPNAYGLYDMAGNVWEWCHDLYAVYSSGSQTDPTGAISGNYRILRGGAYNYNDALNYSHLRSAYRYFDIPSARGSGAGFRCVCSTAPIAVPNAPTISSVVPGDSLLTITYSIVSWAESYNLYYTIGPTVSTSGNKILSITSPYVLRGLTNDSQYTVAISAVNAGGESGLSIPASATPIPPIPAAPTLNSAVGGDGKITMAWDHVTRAYSYNIYYGIGYGSISKGAAGVTKVSSVTSPYVIEGLTNGYSFSVAVCAENSAGESPLSNSLSAATQLSVPDSPVLTNVESGDQKITVTWTGNDKATSYNLYCVPGSTVTKGGGKSTGVTSPHVIQGLMNNTQYAVAVCGNNAAGESELSNILTAIPLTTGLVAHYPLGQNAVDSSGNNNNGTVSNMTAAVNRFSVIGKASSFNGINSYIEIPDAASLTFSKDMSISVWFYPTKLNVAQRVLSKGTEFDRDFHLGIWQDSIFFANIKNESLPVNQIVWKIPAVFKWYHAVFVVKGDTSISLYVNDTLRSSASISTRPGHSSNPLYIGTYPGPTQSFNGIIDDVQLYDIPLSDSMIDSLYRIEGWTGTGLPPAGMTALPAGSFQMGQEVISSATPVHNVNISPFFMDITEVSQGQYFGIMGINPSSTLGDTSRPVERVTWFDAALFCNKRSKLAGLDTIYSFTSITGIPGNGCTNLGGLSISYSKNGYRLPTEAEWEYACRGGTSTVFWWGDDTIGMGARTWTGWNSAGTTHPVATKLPNNYGLYDLTGNVWEWCNDWSGLYESSSLTDPTGPTTGTERIQRGGAWDLSSDNFRSANRISALPTYVNTGTGFRCVRW